MVSNQSLRQEKTIPSNATIMLAEDIIEYLQIEEDYFSDYGPKFGVPWDRIKWLYWILNRFNIGANGGTFYLELETNLEWNIDMSSIPSWLTIATSDRQGDTDKAIPITATQNESINNDRTANILITVGGNEFTHSITQAKTPIQTRTEEFTINQISTGAYDSITITTSDLPITGGNVTIVYRKGSAGAWIERTMPLGSQPFEWVLDNLEDGESYQIQATTTRGQGTAMVTTYNSNIITASTDTIPVLTLSRSSITVDADVTSFTFNIESNVSWSISDNQNWLSVSPTSGSNNRNNITVTLNQNNGSQRSGTITVSASGVPNRTIAVTQRAAAEILTISPTSSNVNNSYSSVQVNITSNKTWSISNYEEFPSWLSVTPLTGNGNGTITVSATQNNGSSRRDYTITIQGETMSRDYEISQAGRTGGGDPDPSDYFPESLRYEMFNHACNSSNTAIYYIDASGSQGLANATVIYTNSQGTQLAPMGYYSNGLYSRQWNGAEFIGGPMQC